MNIAADRPTAREMVDAIQAHALRHYEQGGWDLVIETMEPMDIIDVIWGANTIKGAIWKMSVHVGAIASVRRDIQGA